MKLRNQLLALACLLVFIAFGFLFFRTWVVQKPFGIILFVSDGLSTNTLTAARLYEGGADHKLTIESFPHLGLVTNYASDFAVPDAAAAATAIATGVKGNNKALAVDPRVADRQLRSILSLAHDAGRATGLVTTGNLTDASSAAFYAHTSDARDVQSIARQLVENSKLDVVLGGGLADFTPENKGGKRKDGRDLWLELRGKGYALAKTKAELESTPAFLTGPLAGIFAEGRLPFSSQVQSGSQQPSLSDMVRRAIQFLQTNTRGYVLVVDAALISTAASQNDGEHVLTETVDFDHAVATALQYAGEKTLIVAVGAADVGGLSLNGYPVRADHGVALLGTNANGCPSITWSTGPDKREGRTGGTTSASAPALDLSGSAAAQPSASPSASLASSGTSATPAPTPSATEGKAPEPPPNPEAEPVAFLAPEPINTARDMIAVGAGPGSEQVNGFIDNTDIFKVLKKGL